MRCHGGHITRKMYNQFISERIPCPTRTYKVREEISFSVIYYQYTAQVVLGRGDNRAASYFLPELFSEGSKAVKGSMDVLPFDELSQVRKIPFSRYLKNRINFNNSRRKLRIIPFFAELFAL